MSKGDGAGKSPRIILYSFNNAPHILKETLLVVWRYSCRLQTYKTSPIGLACERNVSPVDIYMFSVIEASV